MFSPRKLVPGASDVFTGSMLGTKRKRITPCVHNARSSADGICNDCEKENLSSVFITPAKPGEKTTTEEGEVVWETSPALEKMRRLQQNSTASSQEAASDIQNVISLYKRARGGVSAEGDNNRVPPSEDPSILKMWLADPEHSNTPRPAKKGKLEVPELRPSKHNQPTQLSSLLQTMKTALQSQPRPSRDVTGQSRDGGYRHVDDALASLYSPPLVPVPKEPRGLTDGKLASSDDKLVEDALASLYGSVIPAMREQGGLPPKMSTVSTTIKGGTQVAPPAPRSAPRVVSVEVKAGPAVARKYNSCRLKVMDFADGSDCKVVLGKDSNDVPRQIFLHDSWTEAPIRTGDHINVVGSFDPSSSSWTVDQEENFLVVQPDILISGTRVAESFNCMRRAVLAEKLPSSGGTNKWTLQGNIMHAVFERAICERNFSTPFLTAELDKQLVSELASIYSIGETEETIKSNVVPSLRNLTGWAELFLSRQPKQKAVVRFGQEDWRVGVARTVDLEENIWSLKFGLKGKIDCTVEAVFQCPDVTQPGGQKLLTHVVPFELKTGKPGFGDTALAHKAQVILYTLMLGDRSDDQVDLGLLFYSKNMEMQGVKAIRAEQRPLLELRNRLASHLADMDGPLPPMLQEFRKCQYCPYLDACTIYHKAKEGGDAQSSGIGHLFDERTSHLSPAQLQYFLDWDHMIDLEYAQIDKSRREIWLEHSEQREKSGKCLAKMVPVAVKPVEEGYLYRFEKTTSAETSFSLLDSQIHEGDPVVLSTEDGHFALATGFVHGTDERHITVHSERLIQPRRFAVSTDLEDLAGNEDATLEQMSMRDDADAEGWHTLLQKPGKLGKEILWRIDKDELKTGFTIIKDNILNLFAVKGDEKRRRLVVDLAPPSFQEPDPQLRFEAFRVCGSSLNVDQREAVSKVLSAEDYVLIQGLPGTGKTTTIVHLVKALLAIGKSILIAAYTHTAVDNILLKLKDQSVDFLRFGRLGQVHEEIKPYTLEGNPSIRSVAALHDFVSSKKVVATTCLGIGNPLFTSPNMKFDYCIVDEASQLTQPACLGPLRFASIFVLVGDHFQLPPLVRNAEAREKGLGDSLFRRLCDAHPGAVARLDHQYRMTADIMLLANTLVYSKMLQCGSKEVAESRLKLPYWQQFAAWTSAPWLHAVLNANTKVVFLNTDAVPAWESRVGEAIQNPMEAKLVHALVDAFVKAGLPPSDIGVIAPYRGQTKLLGALLKNYRGLDVQTVDRYQGRDKDCIMISFVRSNQSRNVGDLMKDWRRLNVALTRAKTKLVMIGSYNTLSSLPVFVELFQLLQQQKWIYPLPPEHSLWASAAAEDGGGPMSESESESKPPTDRPEGVGQSARVGEDLVRTNGKPATMMAGGGTVEGIPSHSLGAVAAASGARSATSGCKLDAGNGEGTTKRQGAPAAPTCTVPSTSPEPADECSFEPSVVPGRPEGSSTTSATAISLHEAKSDNTGATCSTLSKDSQMAREDGQRMSKGPGRRNKPADKVVEKGKERAKGRTTQRTRNGPKLTFVSCSGMGEPVGQSDQGCWGATATSQPEPANVAGQSAELSGGRPAMSALCSTLSVATSDSTSEPKSESSVSTGRHPKLRLAQSIGPSDSTINVASRIPPSDSDLPPCLGDGVRVGAEGTSESEKRECDIVAGRHPGRAPSPSVLPPDPFALTEDPARRYSNLTSLRSAATHPFGSRTGGMSDGVPIHGASHHSRGSQEKPLQPRGQSGGSQEKASRSSDCSADTWSSSGRPLPREPGGSAAASSSVLPAGPSLQADTPSLAGPTDSNSVAAATAERSGGPSLSSPLVFVGKSSGSADAPSSSVDPPPSGSVVGPSSSRTGKPSSTGLVVLRSVTPTPTAEKCGEPSLRLRPPPTGPLVPPSSSPPSSAVAAPSLTSIPVVATKPLSRGHIPTSSATPNGRLPAPTLTPSLGPTGPQPSAPTPALTLVLATSSGSRRRPQSSVTHAATRPVTPSVASLPSRPHSAPPVVVDLDDEDDVVTTKTTEADLKRTRRGLSTVLKPLVAKRTEALLPTLISRSAVAAGDRAETTSAGNIPSKAERKECVDGPKEAVTVSGSKEVEEAIAASGVAGPIASRLERTGSAGLPINGDPPTVLAHARIKPADQSGCSSEATSKQPIAAPHVAVTGSGLAAGAGAQAPSTSDREAKSGAVRAKDAAATAASKKKASSTDLEVDTKPKKVAGGQSAGKKGKQAASSQLGTAQQTLERFGFGLSQSTGPGADGPSQVLSQRRTGKLAAVRKAMGPITQNILDGS